ncbi:MAG: AAA family ATPase [Brevinema sp.]
MIYKVCEGKSLDEARAEAEKLQKREPEARIVHTKTESVPSIFGIKKEKKYQIIVAIPEYDSTWEQPKTNNTPSESVIPPAPTTRLSSIEKQIIEKRSRLAEKSSNDPKQMIASLSRIAEKAELHEKSQALPYPAPPTPAKAKKVKETTPSLFNEDQDSHLEEILSFKNELSELKKLILSQNNTLSSEIQKEQALPNENEIYIQHLRWIERHLQEREFSRYFINAFTKELEKNPEVLSNKNNIITKVKEFLKNNIPVSHLNLDNYQHGSIIALVGPTGVGKTSTLAKFAAHFGFTRKKSLQFVSVDRYKVGAESQLEKYARFMKASFCTVTKNEELQAILSTNESDYVFIDTSGKSPKEKSEIKELSEWLADYPLMMDIHLVVSATTKNADLDYICEGYVDIPYSHIIVTKLDETCSYGSILSAAFKTQKPFSFFTDGQEIPQDFAVADINKMISDSLD